MNLKLRELKDQIDYIKVVDFDYPVSAVTLNNYKSEVNLALVKVFEILEELVDANDD